MAPLQTPAASYVPVDHPEASFWQQFTATLKRNILRKRRTMKHTLTVSAELDKTNVFCLYVTSEREVWIVTGT